VYPEVQKKIQQEVDSIITSDDDNVLENKAKLHYTSKNQLIEVNAKGFYLLLYSIALTSL